MASGLSAPLEGSHPSAQMGSADFETDMRDVDHVTQNHRFELERIFEDHLLQLPAMNRRTASKVLLKPRQMTSSDSFLVH